MPGPSSISPRPVRPSLPAQRFTVSQANKSLPLVRRIVRDIVETHDHALDLQTQIESAPAEHTAAAQKTLDKAMDRLQTLVNELQDVGCELKDYRTGLIDFVGRHQGAGRVPVLEAGRGPNRLLARAVGRLRGAEADLHSHRKQLTTA